MGTSEFSEAARSLPSLASRTPGATGLVEVVVVGGRGARQAVLGPHVAERLDAQGQTARRGGLQEVVAAGAWI